MDDRTEYTAEMLTRIIEYIHENYDAKNKNILGKEENTRLFLSGEINDAIDFGYYQWKQTALCVDY